MNQNQIHLTTLVLIHNAKFKRNPPRNFEKYLFGVYLNDAVSTSSSGYTELNVGMINEE